MARGEDEGVAENISLRSSLAQLDAEDIIAEPSSDTTLDMPKMYNEGVSQIDKVSAKRGNKTNLKNNPTKPLRGKSGLSRVAPRNNNPTLSASHHQPSRPNFTGKGHGLICHSTDLDAIIKHLNEEIAGGDVFELAAKVGFELNPKNKAKHCLLLEHLLSIKPNNCQLPDINGEHELKCAKFYYQPTLGKWNPKNGIKITCLNPEDVKNKEFKDSHVYAKLCSLLISPVLVYKKCSDDEIYAKPIHFKFEDSSEEIRKQLEADYNTIKKKIEDKEKLSGHIGQYMQTRTSGSKNSNTRAFYLKARFIKEDILSKAIHDAQSSLWTKKTGIKLPEPRHSGRTDR